LLQKKTPANPGSPGKLPLKRRETYTTFGCHLTGQFFQELLQVWSDPHRYPEESPFRITGERYFTGPMLFLSNKPTASKQWRKKTPDLCRKWSKNNNNNNK